MQQTLAVSQIPDELERLINSGFTTRTKADAARGAVGRVYEAKYNPIAALRVDVRLVWWWFLKPDGDVIERSLEDMRNMRCLCNLGARAEYKKLTDHRGEFASTDYVYQADYPELLGLLRGVAKERAR